MKVINKEEKSNELLGRKEYKVEIEFKGAVPSKADVKTLLCKELKAKEELSVVREVIPGFKSNKVQTEMFVYSKKEEMDRVEGYMMHKKIEEKIKKAEEAKAQAAEAEKPAEAEAKEEKAEEKPAEEPKEEAKEEAPAEAKEEAAKEE